MAEGERPVSAGTQAGATYPVSSDALAWLRGLCLDTYSATERLDAVRERLLDLSDPRLPPPDPAHLREASAELAHEVDLIADTLMGTVNALEGWADGLEAGGEGNDPEP